MTDARFASLFDNVERKVPSRQRSSLVVIGAIYFDCNAGVGEFLDFGEYPLPPLWIPLEPVFQVFVVVMFKDFSAWTKTEQRSGSCR